MIPLQTNSNSTIQPSGQADTLLVSVGAIVRTTRGAALVAAEVPTRSQWHLPPASDRPDRAVQGAASAMVQSIFPEIGPSDVPIFSPDKIKDARLDAGLSRKELAFAVGRSPVAIKSYETGFWEPPAGALGLLARALGVPVDSFYIAEQVARVAAG